MSADASGTVATAETATPDFAPEPSSGIGGTVDDIRDALGFSEIEDLSPEIARPNAPKDEVAAKRTEKATKPDDSDDTEVADLKAIEARAKERRKTAQAARRKAEPPVAAKVEAPKADTTPAKLGPVEQAVKDTLMAIDALARGDNAAAAANDGAPAPETAARKAELEAITSKLADIQNGLKQTEEGRKQVEAMQAQLKAIESERVIRRHISKAIDAIDGELPTLLDPAALRKFNKEQIAAKLRTFADPIEMIGEAAERYFETYKVAPDMADLARRIERKLKGTDETTATAEKPKKMSKTVSQNETSPPAARSGPDERTHEEAIADFNRRFGLD